MLWDSIIPRPSHLQLLSTCKWKNWSDQKLEAGRPGNDTIPDRSMANIGRCITMEVIYYWEFLATSWNTHAHTHAHTHTPSNRLFLIVKLYYAYAIFATYMVQFYVPMDFLEPPLIKTVHCLFPHRHARIQYPVRIIFRTFMVAITGEFFGGSQGLLTLKPSPSPCCSLCSRL